jgi:hypothetical protein
MTSMKTSTGTYKDPALKPCFEACAACRRCNRKGTFMACDSCSGRLDKKGERIPDRDDYCRCNQGILQWKTSEGQLVQVRYKTSPFAGKVKYEGESQDESDWKSYLNQMREIQNNPTWDPVQFDDGSSTDEWVRKSRER